MTKPHDPEWFLDSGEVVAFARTLLATFTSDWSAEDVISYFEKPWKWTPEHVNWCAGNRAETLHECPDLRDASPSGGPDT